ncbi:MAG TPA: NUDIX domain-containing protein, partial [Chitinophagaceae bacterium]|nr:NUDIX domain-containing protein [Chitinophagaceae bacterium]
KKQITSLPVKLKKTAVKKRWFYYFVLRSENKIAVQQRVEKDIWQGLYEFPMIESGKETPVDQIVKQAIKKGWIKKEALMPLNKIEKYSQQLSHQAVTGFFIKADALHLPDTKWRWITAAERKKLAFPVLINRFLRAE